MQQAPGIGTFGGLPGSSAAGGVCAPLTRTSRLVRAGTAQARAGMPHLAHPKPLTPARVGPFGSMGSGCSGVPGAQGLPASFPLRPMQRALRRGLYLRRCLHSAYVCVLACVQGAPTTPLARSLR
jgi:hypothetical protein